MGALDAKVPEGRVLKFYRAEASFLLQGSMSSPRVASTSHQGPCPAGVDPDINRKQGRKCFPHDPNCGCHGPIMLPGMVAWAGGAGGGPDFFIYMGSTPITFWSHDHTVWGELADE